MKIYSYSILLLLSCTAFTMEKQPTPSPADPSPSSSKQPSQPAASSSSSSSNTPYQFSDSERNTLNAIQFSENLEPLSEDDCKYYLESAPQKIQDRITALTKSEILNRRRGTKKIFFAGPPGSGKSTLAIVVAQKLRTPFIIVDAPAIPNEFKNSGASGIIRIMKILESQKRNIIIEEFDCLARENKKNSLNESSDNTPAEFWRLIDLIDKKGIYLFGTTNNLSNFPQPLKDRLGGPIFEMPGIESFNIRKERLQRFIGTDIKIDSEQTLIAVCKATDGFSNRQLMMVIEFAVDSALIKNQTTPVLTQEDFKEALDQIKFATAMLNKSDVDKRDLLTMIAQGSSITINGLSAINIIYSMYISRENLSLTKINMLFNLFNSIQADIRAAQSQKLTKESMAQAQRIADRSDQRAEESQQIARDAADLSAFIACAQDSRAKEAQEQNQQNADRADGRTLFGMGAQIGTAIGGAAGAAAVAAGLINPTTAPIIVGVAAVAGGPSALGIDAITNSSTVQSIKNAVAAKTSSCTLL